LKSYFSISAFVSGQLIRRIKPPFIFQLLKLIREEDGARVGLEVIRVLGSAAMVEIFKREWELGRGICDDVDNAGGLEE
jgi:hypothetical protein